MSEVKRNIRSSQKNVVEGFVGTGFVNIFERFIIDRSDVIVREGD